MKIKEFLFRTRRGLFLLLLVVAGCLYFINKLFFAQSSTTVEKFEVPEENVFIFPKLTGPSESSVVKPPIHTSWRKYHVDDPSAMAILLTDTESRWIGLAHGLTNIGISFTITTDVAEAIKHPVVMTYPIISGTVLDKQALQAIAAIPRNGGTLIATNVYGGGLNEIFNYDDIVPSKGRTTMRTGTGSSGIGSDSIFSDLIDRKLIFSGGADTPNAIATVGYTNAKVQLLSFDDGTGCLVYKDYGVGKSYALGIDIGNYCLKYMNGRGFDANRAYVNRYDAGIDVLLRIIKQIYISGSKSAVTIGTVPYNKSFTLLLTHDIDFTRSIVNAAKYAEMEKAAGVKATYFIQTKYIKDWNDDIFFNSTNIQYLQKVRDLGMEIGSHSVAHSKVFSTFPMGDGKEQYPGYRPFVKERTVTYNGTILGELRVSKFLLQHFSHNDIHSFRPGHLQYPFALPQTLEATGFSNSSSVTTGCVQTSLPFMLTYDRTYDAETNIVEVPVAVEDEAGLPMLQRLDSTIYLAGQLSKYGGVLNILIHTDILVQKYEYEQKVISQLKDKAWISTLGEFGDWWRARNNVRVSVSEAGGRHVVAVTNPGKEAIRGLTLQIPRSWKLQNSDVHIKQDGNAIILDELNGMLSLSFK